MSLKSLVNKSIIKSDLRRFWYLGALFVVALVLFAVIPVAESLQSETYVISSVKGFCVTAEEAVIPVILFGIIIPAVVFSYLHHKSAVADVHRLPLKRSALFVSHLISIAVLLAVPVLINGAILLTFHAQPAHVLVWIGLTYVYCFVLASFASMAAVITANIIASIVIPYIFIVLPQFIEVMARALCRNYLIGFSGYVATYRTSFLYKSYRQLLSGGAALYLILGAAFLIIGYFCYKKRALENHSRVVAFPTLEPIFLYSFAMCAGLLGYLYISEVSNIYTLAAALPFGILGIIIAKMILNRSFRPGNIIKPTGLYLCLMLVIYVFIGLDITGFEKRVPDAEEVASVNVIYSAGIGDSTYRSFANNPMGESVLIAPEALHDYLIYDTDDIEKVCELQRALIEANQSEQKDDVSLGLASISIPIEYELKNGRKLIRLYTALPTEALNEKYGAVMDIGPVKADRFSILSETQKEYTSAYVSSCNQNSKSLSSEQMNQLIEAMKKDITDSSYEDYSAYSAITSVTISYILPCLDTNDSYITDKSRWSSTTEQYCIYPSYTASINLLKEWGMYHDIPSPEAINRIEIRDHEDFIGVYDNSSVFENAVTDKTEIEKILNYLVSHEDDFVPSITDGVKNVRIFFGDYDQWSVNIKEMGDY